MNAISVQWYFVNSRDEVFFSLILNLPQIDSSELIARFMYSNNNTRFRSQNYYHNDYRDNNFGVIFQFCGSKVKDVESNDLADQQMALTVIHTMNGANVMFAHCVVFYGISPHLMTQLVECAAFNTLYGFGIIVFDLIWIQFHSSLSMFVGMVSSSLYQFPINMIKPTNCSNGNVFFPAEQLHQIFR